MAYLLRSPANTSRLGAALERAERGEGMVVSGEDLAAMKGEIEALASAGVTGGVSPRLERLIRAEKGQGRVGRV
jgi:hypothetical protein